MNVNSQELNDIPAGECVRAAHCRQVQTELIQASLNNRVCNQSLEIYRFAISHDLRAQARAMTCFSEIVLEEACSTLNAEVNDSLQRVVSAGKRMHQLIEGFLELGRVASHNVITSRMDLSDIARNACNEGKRGTRRASIDWQIENKLPVRGDESLIVLMVESLISSITQLVSGQLNPVVTLSCVNPLQGKNYCFRCAGVEIHKRVVEKLFAPFQSIQIGANTIDSGIDLALAQCVAQRHDGRMWAEMTAGKDLAILFDLPVESYQAT